MLENPTYLFARHYEISRTDFEFDPISTSLAGLGIGLLATAAVSLSHKLDDIPLAGAEVIRAAFRLGVLVEEVSSNLQPRDLTNTNSHESWAYVLPDVSSGEAQAELDAFHASEVWFSR